MTKDCMKCNATKPTSEFYKDSQNKDGLCNWCKMCRRQKDINYRLENPEKVSASKASYAKTDKNKQRKKAYRLSEVGKAKKHAEYIRYKDSSPDKIYARKVLHNGIVSGLVAKPDGCWCCGSVVKIEGHHSDYQNPLGVTWLCRACHVRAHDETKEYLAGGAQKAA